MPTSDDNDENDDDDVREKISCIQKYRMNE